MGMNNKKIKSIVTFLICGLLTGFVGFTYAKYIESVLTSSNKADPAKWGTIGIREHIVVEEIVEEEEENGENVEKVTYRFSEETYPIENSSETLVSNLQKGRNIPFYPCVFLEGDFEVSFWLYLKVVQTDYNVFGADKGDEKDPEAPIECHIDDKTWLSSDEPPKPVSNDFVKITTTIYRYRNPLPSAGEKIDGSLEIPILEHNVIHITESYSPDKYEGFDIRFSAWIQQISNPDQIDDPL